MPTETPTPTEPTITKVQIELTQEQQRFELIKAVAGSLSMLNGSMNMPPGEVANRTIEIADMIIYKMQNKK